MYTVLNKKYDEVFDNLPIMIHSIDSKGFIINVNKCWLETMGFDKSEVIDRRSVDFHTEASRNYASEYILPSLQVTGKNLNIPFQLITKKDQKVDVLLSSNVNFDDNGNFLYSTALMTNITKIQTIKENTSKLQDYASLENTASTPQQKLLLLRNQLNLNQEQMSEILGTSNRTYQRIEHGESSLTTDMILLIAQKLDVSPHYFF